MIFDAAIVGAGIVGLSIARELLSRGVSVVILEAEEDVGRHASGRNSGVVHPGFAVHPGSLKARLNVEGSRLLPQVCAELSVPYRQVGTLVVAAGPGDVDQLETLRAQGEANGLTELRIIDADELARLEPTVAGHAALFAEQGAIVDPHALVYHLAECCVREGAALRCGWDLSVAAREGDVWSLECDAGEADARLLVNAAGVRAPDVSALAGGERYESFPCRGEYLVLDRAATGVPGRMVYPTPPRSGGLGVHFTPTIHGNTLIGPSAEYIGDGGDFGTEGDILELLLAEASALSPGLRRSDVITSFSGVRSKISKGAYGTADFVIGMSDAAPGLLNLCGIESPGLSASPAIARMAGDLATGVLGERAIPVAFDPTYGAREEFSAASEEERARRADADPDERAIVCRCEQVTRREVLDALDSAPGAASLAAVKMRCRAGTGRCQGSFCTPRIVGILRDERDMAVEDITLKGPGSELFAGGAKALFDDVAACADAGEVVGDGA